MIARLFQTDMHFRETRRKNEEENEIMSDKYAECLKYIAARKKDMPRISEYSVYAYIYGLNGIACTYARLHRSPLE